jgi:hypothetical protein
MLKCVCRLAKEPEDRAMSGSAKDLNLRLIGAELPWRTNQLFIAVSPISLHCLFLYFLFFIDADVHAA